MYKGFSKRWLGRLIQYCLYHAHKFISPHKDASGPGGKLLAAVDLGLSGGKSWLFSQYLVLGCDRAASRSKFPAQD